MSKQGTTNVTMPKPEQGEPVFAGQEGRFLLYKADCLQLTPLFPPGSFDGSVISFL
jgi:hypothetical protein